MERLTERDANCADPKEIYGVRVKNHDYISAANRLADYEDTGLTPKFVQETAELAIWVHENGLEKIKEWIKADREGRLIIVDNTPRQISPCDTCESGWGKVTTTGYDSCFNHCEKLAEYRKREG